jgi:hypothetical protein
MAQERPWLITVTNEGVFDQQMAMPSDEVAERITGGRVIGNWQQEGFLKPSAAKARVNLAPFSCFGRSISVNEERQEEISASTNT